VKERRKGPLGRATGIAEGVAAAVRRRAREREPRVLVYLRPGFPQLVQPGSREWDRLLGICERMVELEGALPEEDEVLELDAPDDAAALALAEDETGPGTGAPGA
jgi:hypothetical protein